MSLAHAADATGAALEAARTAFIARNPRSQARHAKATAVMPGGNTRTVLFYDPFPLTILRGEGCHLWDADGHEYTDFLGEFTAGIYGHSDPVIRAAIDAALDGGINLSGHNGREAELAELVCARFPSIEQVRFTNSGTEANLMALALATAHTGRRKIMVFAGGYHGGVLTFGSSPSRINVPHEFIIAPYNDLAEARRLAEQHRGDLAAILVEPMMGSGGCIAGEPDFLQGLRDCASELGALLIFDEVMTSRLSPGGLQQALGILPDLTALGKYIGGGMSFGAFGGRADLMAMFDPRRPDALAHAGTFNNNVLTMSAGVAGLSQVYTPAAAIALNARGDRLRERLNELCREHQAPMQFTGIGSLMSLQTTARPIRCPADAATGDPRLRDLFFFDMLEQGIYLAHRGMMTLSLPIGDAEEASLLTALSSFLDRYR